MKAKKALKRLSKIEALLSDVTERYSAGAPNMRKVLQDAKAAVTRAKEAMSWQASFGAAKNPQVEHPNPASKPTPEPSKPKRKLSAAGRKAIVAATKARWTRVRAESAVTTKKTQPAAKKARPKKAALKKIAIKKVAAKAPTAKAAKKAPTKVTVKKAAPKRSAPATTAQAPAMKAAPVTAEPIGAAESVPTPEVVA
jgi:adenylate kinase